MVATVARTTNPLPWWFGQIKKLCYWPVDTKVAKSCPEQVLVRTVLEHPAVQGLESQLLVDTDGVLKPSSYLIKDFFWYGLLPAISLKWFGSAYCDTGYTIYLYTNSWSEPFSWQALYNIANEPRNVMF